MNYSTLLEPILQLMKYLLIIFFFTFYCCAKKNNNHEFSKVKEDNIFKNITILFKEAPKKQFISVREHSILGGRMYFSSIASYIDSEGIIHHINPKRSPNKDTIVIPLDKSELEIYFEQSNLEGRSYLFKNGDSILVSYKNKKPVITLLNRKFKPYDYNFEQFKTKYKSDSILTEFERFFRALEPPTPMMMNQNLTKDEMRSFHKRRLKEKSLTLESVLKIQKNELDSLYNLNLVSEDIYEYYAQRIQYTYWSMLAMLKELPIAKKDSLSESIESKLSSKNNKRTIVNTFNYNNINTTNIILSGDSLLNKRAYYEFLNYAFLPNYLENTTTETTYEYNNFGGSYYDWSAVYDSIEKNTWLPKNVKNFLLYKYMDKIAMDLSPKTTSKYYKKIKDIGINDTYISLIDNKYSIDETKTYKLTLRDSLGSTLYYEDVLKNNLGKVIYVDFGASWCQPCIKEIVFKNSIRKRYKTKNIIFISVSIDKSFVVWRSSKLFESTRENHHNYILTNPLSSEFIKKNNVVYVPRYFLYNKQGKLVNADAPAPSSPKIFSLIDTLLK